MAATAAPREHTHDELNQERVDERPSHARIGLTVRPLVREYAACAKTAAQEQSVSLFPFSENGRQGAV